MPHFPLLHRDGQVLRKQGSGSRPGTRKSDCHATQAGGQVSMLEKWLQIANWAQMLGAALVAAGTIAYYYLSKEVIADREQRIASANERAERAGADAAQARLELARLKAPRTIPPEHQERFATALRKFPGQPYELAGAGQDREVRTFLTELDGMLTDFGWRRVPSQKGDYSMIISEYARRHARRGRCWGDGACVADRPRGKE